MRFNEQFGYQFHLHTLNLQKDTSETWLVPKALMSFVDKQNYKNDCYMMMESIMLILKIQHQTQNPIYLLVCEIHTDY